MFFVFPMFCKKGKQTHKKIPENPTHDVHRVKVETVGTLLDRINASKRGKKNSSEHVWSEIDFLFFINFASLQILNLNRKIARKTVWFWIFSLE